jgi:hypothetical protein
MPHTALTALNSSIRFADKHRYIVFVIVGALFAHAAIWNAGIPMGDEGVHILQGLRILSGEIQSFNPYYLIYAALLSVTEEPVIAHLIVRFAVSAGSTLGLYLVLRSFRSISALGATLATLAWIGATLCTPYTQLGNNSLLCLTLVLPPLAWVLRAPSLTSLSGFALAAIWAANVRPEYFAPLVLVPLGGLILVRISRARSPASATTKGGRVTALLMAALAASLLATAFKPAEPGASLQTYLLQGLGQCYAVYYKRLHPEQRFNPMSEYQGVLDRVFGNPRTFTEALANNPGEAARYFFHNGTRNLGMLVRELLRGRRGVATGVILLVVGIGTVIGLVGWLRRRASGVPAEPERHVAMARVLLLLLFGMASMVSIVLLIPDSRYWASWVPLIYLWLAWSFDRVFGALTGSRWELLILPLAVLLFDRSEFVGKRSYKPVIDAVRIEMAGMPRKPVVAGNFIVGLSTYALRGNAVQVNTYNGLSVDGLRNRNYDVFVADGLEGTALWANNEEFFNALVKSPARLGYRLLPISVEHDSLIFVRAPDRP